MLEVDCSRFLIEKVGYLDELRKVAVEAVSEFFSGDEVEHVGLSVKMTALDGRCPSFWGPVMYFSMASWVVLMTKSWPFDTPTAKLCGRR